MTGPVRRLLVMGVATAVWLMGVGLVPAAAAPADQFVNKVNSARKSAGKDPVLVYWDLTDDARRHARDMADAQKVYTIPNVGKVTSGWKSLGQVVGVGPNVSVLFDSFMSYPAQRSTILGSYNYIGVGTVKDANGILWVSMIFMRGPDGLVDPPDDTTTTTSSTTSTTKAPTTTKPPSNTTTTSTTTTTKAPPPTTTTTTTTKAPEEDQPAPTTTVAVAPPPTTAAPPPPTTTTTSPPVAAADPGGEGGAPAAAVLTRRDAAIPQSAGSQGIGAGWIVSMFALLALAAFAWLARVDRRGLALAGGSLGEAATTVFGPCRRCGIVFDTAALAACPNCNTATG